MQMVSREDEKKIKTQAELKRIGTPSSLRNFLYSQVKKGNRVTRYLNFFKYTSNIEWQETMRGIMKKRGTIDCCFGVGVEDISIELGSKIGIYSEDYARFHDEIGDLIYFNEIKDEYGYDKIRMTTFLDCLETGLFKEYSIQEKDAFWQIAEKTKENDSLYRLGLNDVIVDIHMQPYAYFDCFATGINLRDYTSIVNRMIKISMSFNAWVSGERERISKETESSIKEYGNYSL